MVDRPVHLFQVDRAHTYGPNPDFAKRAILVDVTDPHTETILNSPFGEQSLIGPFYIVAEGSLSYGAAKAEFDAAHRSVGPNLWVKHEPILAYQVDSRCSVETYLGDHKETTVEAEPGDWIVQQGTGEVMVVLPDEFARRYVMTSNATASS